MEPLSLELADRLAAEFFAGDAPVSSASRDYTIEEMLFFLRMNLAGMRSEVEHMTPEQLAYRLPGVPEGADASGDEAHFNTAEIVTHMVTGNAFHWWNITRALKQERPPMPKPPEGTAATGKRRDGMGSGGWSGMSGRELADHLNTNSEALLAYIEGLPAEAFRTGSASFGPFRDMAPHDWLFLIAVHSGIHLSQIRTMKAQEDFPA